MDRANGPGAATTRAERFEDEKRRIIESCFNKKDSDGSRTYCTAQTLRFSRRDAGAARRPGRAPDGEVGGQQGIID